MSSSGMRKEGSTTNTRRCRRLSGRETCRDLRSTNLTLPSKFNAGSFQLGEPASLGYSMLIQSRSLLRYGKCKISLKIPSNLSAFFNWKVSRFWRERSREQQPVIFYLSSSVWYSQNKPAIFPTIALALNLNLGDDPSRQEMHLWEHDCLQGSYIFTSYSGHQKAS